MANWSYLTGPGLFGTPFLTPSRFKGEQYHPIKVCKVTRVQLEVTDHLISNNINQHFALVSVRV